MRVTDFAGKDLKGDEPDPLKIRLMCVELMTVIKPVDCYDQGVDVSWIEV